MKTRAAKARLVFAFATLLALLIAAPPARGQATITVNSTAQEVTLATPTGVVNGNCTLGEAILAANTNAAVDGCTAGQTGGTDTIVIPAGTYTLDSVAKNPAPFNTPVGLPDITEAVILQGAGATTTILERSSAGGTPAFALTLAIGGALNFEKLTIRNFFTTCGQGGAAVMRFTVPVTLNDSIVENNFSDANCGGGNGAFAEMFNSNAAFSATNTLFRNNTAQFTSGIVLFASGPVTLTNCTFLNNLALTANQGAMFLGGDGPFNISNSVFSGNLGAAGGVMHLGGLGNCGPGCGTNPVINITRSVFLNNATPCCGSGAFIGGVLESGGQNVTMTITESTFAGNTADQRGGAFSIDGTGTVTIRNSTFFGNTAGGGGAIFAYGGVALNLNNVTMIDNTASAGAIFLENTSTATLRNTIVALTVNPTACNLVSAGGQPLFASQGHNVFGHTTCAGFSVTDVTDQSGTQSAPLDPLVQALADNASTMMAGANIAGVISPQAIQTMGLITGSPALNMGDPGTADGMGTHCEATDQRGLARPQPMGGVCDVGAFEDLTGAGVPASFDLSVTKTDSPDPVLVNNNVTYTVTVSNAGPDGAPSVVLTDTLPAGVNFVSAVPSNAPSGTCMQAAGTVTCNLGTLAASGTVTVDIVVTVTGAANSVISNTASVSATGTESNSADNTDTETTTVTGVTVDLSVTKTDSPDPIHLGQGNVTYAVTVANAGPGSASNVVLTDMLPAGAGFVSAMPSQGTCPAPVGGVLTCNLGAIANGAMATISIVVTPTASGTLTNTVSVAATETDSTPGNNSATATTTVNPAANLSITKTDSPDPVNVGSNLTYSVTVSNAGPSTATNVTLTDNLPANTNFASAVASQGACPAPVGAVLTCNLGAINNGAMATVTIVVTPQAAAAGMISNTASVTAAEFDPSAPNMATATTTVNPVADLSVTKSDAPDPVTQGSNITYTITISNAGPSAATGVMATDAVPANVTFVSATGSQGTCTQAAGTITCNVGTINSGANATATVVVTATATGTVTNTINVSSAVTDPNAANNSATATTTVNPSTSASDFTIAAAPALQTVSPGQTATFTVTLTPLGGSFSSAIALSCFLDPPLGPCSLSPTSVTPGAAPGSSTLTVMVPNSGAMPRRVPSPSPQWPVFVLVSALAMLAVWRAAGNLQKRQRRYAAGLALLAVIVALGALQSACTTAGNGLKGAYTVTVTATSGSLSHATNVTVNVQ